MEDRELLELAATAAGVEYNTQPNVPQFHDMLTLNTASRFWRPLADDGDALRLAATLMIGVEWETEYIVFADGNFSEDIKDHNNDRAAAIRRAIVRAAALGTW